MAWTAPATATVGQLVTASFWNAQVRDNMSYLGGAAGAVVTTAQGTSSATYTDLATTGPAVTVTTGTKALVLLHAEIDALGLPAYMSFAVSGASTVAATDNTCLKWAHHATGGYVVDLGTPLYVSGLTAGSNTFTCKYRTDSGTPTWGFRHIVVVPLT